MKVGEYLIIDKFVYLIVRIERNLDSITIKCHDTNSIHIMSYRILMYELSLGNVKTCGKLCKLLYS